MKNPNTDTNLTLLRWSVLLAAVSAIAAVVALFC